MTNKEIAKEFQLTAALMELHGYKPQDIRIYSGTAFQVERLEQQIEGLDKETLKGLGFRSAVLDDLRQLILEGSFLALDEVRNKTPEGVLDLFDVKGLGVKKIQVLWQEKGIDSVKKLYEACVKGEVSSIKGFGAKTQEKIIAQIEFLKENSKKLHWAKALPLAEEIAQEVRNRLPEVTVDIVGEVRRKLEIVEELAFVVAAAKHLSFETLSEIEGLDLEVNLSGPFIIRGVTAEIGIPVVFHLASSEERTNAVFLNSAAGAHLALTGKDGKSLGFLARTNIYTSEAALYQAIEWPEVPVELREGFVENQWVKADPPKVLIDGGDLRGILHNHSTYSDGKHSLREMAEECIAMGMQYFGISDHSQTAFYANGLTEDRVLRQHQEIDELNKELAPFKIFKGIESDILGDGSLDYPQEVLETFDFIVASVHSNLNMEIEKATDRLIAAIENPYTTILGHPTGRLLLKREGYPIDHQKVIDACAANDVAIEINASPWRLDLDWRWIPYALEKGVKIAINPDAHDKEGLHHMQYGLAVARKGGLTKEETLNAMSLEEIIAYFKK